MSFRWYIYYCALFGGCSAYVGWALGRLPSVETPFLLAVIRGLFLGLTLALGLTLVDIVWHHSRRDRADAIWRLLVAGLAGSAGGILGGAVGQRLYGPTQWSVFLILGWAITGTLIGAAPALFDLLIRLAQDEDSSAARRKLWNGILGGSVGGMLGGLLYLLIRGVWALILGDRADQFWSPSATGFVALGLCIGLFIGLAQVILKTAWITVVTGFRAGRELLLSRNEMILGRAEGCDIPLFGDSQAEKQHARIVLQGGNYYLEDLQSPNGTFVNGQRLTQPTRLHSGDLIEIGRSALRFGERIKRVGSA